MRPEAADPDPELERRIGYRFADPGLLREALTHASYARERDGSCGNERLELLGDAALDLVVTEALYRAHPDWSEGALTRARAALVNGPALAARARDLELGTRLRLGRSEQRSRGFEKASILANVFEALAGALYLDGGIPAVEALARVALPSAFDPGAPPAPPEPKTRLNEWADLQGRARPVYRLLRDSGEEDAEDRFTVAVELGGRLLAQATARTKRSAERQAAAGALARLERAEE